MEVLTANETKVDLGELLLKTRKAPVQITRSGKPVAIAMSTEDYETVEAFKMRYLKEELARSQADVENGRIEDMDVFFADLMAGKYD